LDIGGPAPADRNVEGVVEMMLDATQKYSEPLTAERLAGWHASLFPTGYSGIRKTAVGRWRDDARGPMQVVSGALGRERVHFEAPAAKRLKKEMALFLKWFNGADDTDPVLRAGLAHLWFVTIHPFEDGNGRIARAIADMALARSEQSPQRFYSMSAQIRNERKTYYEIMEKSQKGGLRNLAAGSLYDFLYLFRRTSWQMDMTNVLLVALNESWNSPGGKTQFFAFIKEGIVEQRDLLNLGEQPWRNPRLFYAQCGSKAAADLFGGWVSFAYGRGYAS
jgi:fido (protein-threonine AMPylation protein)